MRKSKRYRLLKEKMSKENHTLDEAISLIKETVNAQFDESVELHINLGIDPKQSDQIVRGTITLPSGTGKTLRIAVFTESQSKPAKDAGADLVGGKELVDELVKTKKIAFDVAVATPDFMRNLAKAAKLLGTKGLMPSPKNGTVTDDVSAVVTKLNAGQITFRNDDSGNLHQMVGKVSSDEKALKENITLFINAIKKARPKGIKGTYLKSITLTTTMGPGIRIAV